VNPDALTCQALLNCLIREVSAPEEQVREDDGQLLIRLARSGAELRAGLRRRPAGSAPRPDGWVQLRCGATWQTIGWQRLADLVAGELTLATGVANPEFADQVRDSHASVTAILAARAGRPVMPQVGTGGTGPQGGPGGAGRDRIGRYLASEQALIAGHRFHPSPKARQGAPRDWLRYAPEAGARFRLRFLGVRDEVLAAEGDCAGLDRLGGPVPPRGYQVLPAHPWQFRLLAGQPWLRDALRRGLVVDLGEGSREVAATSSVRTVYDPAADVFCKFSLNVRITNCVRKSAWYELAGAVALTRLLTPVFAELAGRSGGAAWPGPVRPGAVLLGEPGYRTVALAARDAYEGLAVIVRDGVRAATAPGVTPLLAASLTEPAPGLFDGRERDWLLGWWQAYLRAVARPVLGAFFGHGVVLEPHLQNVLIGVDRSGWPVQAIFRDLEGTKLVAARHRALLASLAPGIARGLAYDERRGWDRVAYCLLVNHLSEIAAAIADRHPEEPAWEHELWRRARRVLTEAADEHGWPPPLQAVLAGVPLPAKANLRLRWARGADRDAGYVRVPNPLRATTSGREPVDRHATGQQLAGLANLRQDDLELV
jgi:siderophore synthetase component